MYAACICEFGIPTGQLNESHGPQNTPDPSDDDYESCHLQDSRYNVQIESLGSTCGLTAWLKEAGSKR